MQRTTYTPGVPRREHRSEDQTIPFVSICPKCGRPEPQLAFSRSALQRSLEKGHPIEAYCAMCDVFWRVSPHERRTSKAVIASNESGPLRTPGSTASVETGSFCEAHPAISVVEMAMDAIATETIRDEVTTAYWKVRVVPLTVICACTSACIVPSLAIE